MINIFHDISGFVWTGVINWYLRDLVTVPLICRQSSALINLQQREISHLHLRKKSCTVYLKTETVEPGLMRTRKGHATVYILSGCPYQAGSQEKNVKTHVYRYKD